MHPFYVENHLFHIIIFQPTASACTARNGQSANRNRWFVFGGNKVGMGRGNSLPPKEKHRNNTTLCRYFITFAPDNG
jgi:hypothetical protein